MTKVFEDLFSELQADMVSICLEYVNYEADYIYLNCSNESGMLSSNFFYMINGEIIEKHRLNDVTTKKITYDVSIQRQKVAAEIINKNIQEIEKICLEYKQEVPKDIKIIYNLKDMSCDFEYSYENVFSDKKDLSFYDTTKEWFSNIKSSVTN